jgi:signal peptidase I
VAPFLGESGGSIRLTVRAKVTGAAAGRSTFERNPVIAAGSEIGQLRLMTNLFASPRRKARAAAAQWLELAATVWHFRRDVLTAAEAADLARGRRELGELVRAGAGPDQLKPAMSELEATLRRTGGAYFPRPALAENIEFFLVAAIVILGIRAYFLQPMVIPTNSMWPTYFGMTPENFPPGTAAPGLLERAARLVAFGAVPKEMDAPATGEVSAPLVFDTRGNLQTYPASVEGKKWLVLPDKLSEYTLYVDEVPVKIRLPEDFHDFQQVVLDTYLPPGRSLADQWKQEVAAGRVRRSLETDGASRSYYVYRLPLGKTVRAGEPILRFDLMKGDMLVVDRFSYHFVRPQVGSAFVFETGKVPGLVQEGIPDEYYIKRLAGVPGDTLEIKEPVLYRNGQPITGAKAFDLNNRRVSPYPGYVNAPSDVGRYLLPGKPATVPPDSFVALGDNSPDSGDSRYWGFVPEREVVGRPLFIYYPFTRRWGIAH